MSDAPIPTALTLSNADAAQWNRDLMVVFQAELERNPKADLLSMFSRSYCLEHRNSQYSQLSYAGQINLKTLHWLRDTLRDEPEVNMLAEFPKDYNRRISMATGPKASSPTENNTPEMQGPEFRTRLDHAETATIIFPLSKEVTALLAQLSGDRDIGERPGDNREILTIPLKQLLWKSPVWENPIRGVVVKCDNSIIAKVILGNRDYTEYTSLKFLAERAPDIPAPRPHGLIAFGHFRVIFMSYIPDITLAKVWIDLSHEAKLSIQQQLDKIFCRLRSLRQDEGTTLGGVRGEGAKELRVDECALFKDITTAAEYSNLQFSARHHGSKSYVSLLRSFLHHEHSDINHGLVFTHGDIRTDNIIVRRDANKSGY